MNNTVYILLANGSVIEGKSFGAVHETIGEIVFTTSMTGYLETLTDPSYYGQIVVQAFPLIGNYGVITPDLESKKSYVSGYIVREWCQMPSNFRCEGNIDTFLKNNNVTGVYGIDTRSLTKTIRESGVMNGAITFSLDNKEELLEKIKSYNIKDAVKNVTSLDIMTETPKNKKRKVVLMDFGSKRNITRELLKRGCEVITVPGNTTAEDILKLNPDGIMLSNGPGDPAENVDIIKELKKLKESKTPIFGICLGHQLLALASGAKTGKLKYGHRGANQPVKNLETGRVYITSQNHGYAVVNESLDRKIGKVLFVNANDSTCEGIRYEDSPAFSVQYHPEASGGPLDTSFLFDEFINLMDNN